MENVKGLTFEIKMNYGPKPTYRVNVHHVDNIGVHGNFMVIKPEAEKSEWINSGLFRWDKIISMKRVNG